MRYQRPSPDNTCAGAKAFEALIRQKLARGEALEEEVKEKNKIPIFKEFAQKWMDVYVKNNNKYSEILNKESLLRAHLNPFFGSKRLNEISSMDVESYKAEKIKSGQANKSVNNHLIALSKCLKVAQEWEIIKNIPKIKLLKVRPQKFDFLSAEECQLLLNNCDGLLKEMVLVGLKTGLRFGELIALEWSNINFKDNLMVVEKSITRGQIGSTKSNKIRHIPLLDDVRETLLAKDKNTGFVFTINGGPLIPMTCLAWLHSACRRVGLRRIGWHCLRHTFASHLAQNGVSIMLIKELLGHADIRTTMRYSHLTSSAVNEAIQTINKNFDYNMTTISNLGEERTPALATAGFKMLVKPQ
jgi:integrase